MANTYLNQNQKILATKAWQKLESEKMFRIKNEIIGSSFNQNFYSNITYNQQQYLNNNAIRLRGGGCGKSKIEKNIDSQIKKDENKINLQYLPENYIKNLEECLKLITEQATQIGDSNKRNEVIKKIQWFLYNREYLNYFCIDEQAGKTIYDLVIANFGQLLEVLITYLRNSGFICYQVLQICNELLRIIYSFQLGNSGRFFEEEVKQGYLQNLQELDTQLEIEQAHVWKTGIEFEVTIMKIMIMNSQTNSTEGKDLLIEFFKQAAQSIVSLQPSEDLLSTIIEGGKYLLKKGIEKKLYPKETYQTYYFFQLIKWSIIKQLKSQFSVYKQIQQLKDLFSQYILVSDNWIIHFSWIQIITDIIGYRPIIDKFILEKYGQNSSTNRWNQLIENNLIRCVSYNKNQAIMYLFDQERKIHDIELTSILDNEGKKKFLLFSQFLLKGDLTQSINIWNYYKEFSFKKQEDKKQDDCEIILASQEQEILQQLIYNLNSEKDEVIQIYEGIVQSFSKYPQESDQMFIQIFKDDQETSQKQLLETFKKLIILSYKIQELSQFEASKFDIFQPHQEQLQNQKKLKGQIDLFVKIEIEEFINQLVDFFFIFIQFVSTAYSKSIFLDSKNQVNQDNKINQLEVDNFQKFFLNFEAKFNQFSLNLIQYKTDFEKFLRKQKEILQEIPAQNIIDTFKSNCNGELINIIINKLQSNIYKDNLYLYDFQLRTLDDAKQNLIQCKFIMLIFKFLKQFSNIQQKNVEVIYNQLLNYTKKNEEQIEFRDDVQKQIIVSVLTQQKLKITQLLGQNINESDQNFQFCCNSYLSQIQSDFIVIKKECGKQEKTYILEFFTEVQFQILQVLNQIENISILKNLLEKYDEFIKIIQSLGQPHSQNDEQEQDFESMPQSFQNLYKKNNSKLILDIKKTRKYFKQYEKMLILQIDLLDQPNEVQDQTNKFQQFQEKRRDIFFCENVKTQIKKLIESLSDYYQQKEQEQEQEKGQKKDFSLKLMEYLSFFHSLFNSNYFNQMKVDKINDSIWQDIKNAYQNTKEKLLDLINFKPDHKIREGLVYNLIRLQFSIQEQQINSFSTKYLQFMWIYEKDQKVRNLLKNKELIEIQRQLFAQDLDNLSGQIKDELKEKMIRLENLQQRIKLEGNQQKRDQLQIELRKTYDQLDESLDNISEMSEAMDISLIFLKDISKDVKQIKIQIDKIQESINQVADDVRKLRGKNYKELLEIRKQKILFQSKLSDVDSVYIQLKTIEYNPVTGEIIKNEEKEITQLMQDQWNDFKEGEINEFIWRDGKKKDVMLLSGNAGSGKSKAARKIEEFLWKQQDKIEQNDNNHNNNKEEIKIKWTPIFVSLPTIKDPKYSLFEQALESENYQFDQYQVREFKEAIQNKKEFIILILDSYDEMKQENIQSNLIITNKLLQDLNIDETINQVKFIITSRKEILNTLGYQTWFYGKSLKSMKEVQIQDFNKDQKKDYLVQYTELSVKRIIRASYDFLKQCSLENFNLDEFLNIWSLIQSKMQQCIQNNKEKQNESFFQEYEIENIVKQILELPLFTNLTNDQIISLKKDLASIWSVYKFEQAIQNVGVNDLLSTPFMLEIVVQVLPNLEKRQQGSVDIKNKFVQVYMNIKQRSIISQVLREQYKNQIIKKDYDQTNNSQFDGKKPFQNHTFKQNFDQSQITIQKLLDDLESKKFFQFQSLTSNIKFDKNNSEISIINEQNKIRIKKEDIEFVVQALQMKKFTIYEFYESFMHFYHDQQIQKLRDQGKISNLESFQVDLYNFSSNLALEMTINELSLIQYQQKGKLKLKNNYQKYQEDNDWFDEYFDDSQNEHEYNKLIRSCVLLNAKGCSYSFTHKSIQEFQVSKYILSFLSSLNTQKLNYSFLESKYSKRLLDSLYNNDRMNLSKDNYKGILKFIKEKLKSIENIKNILIYIVQLSCDNQFINAASNSMYLLNYLDIYLGYQNFSKIQLSNTNLSGFNFFFTDLSNSKFSNININSCNFNYSNLTNVVWKDIVCKEKPNLKGHNQSVKLVQYQPNGDLIASLGADGIIKLWDIYNYQPILDNFGIQQITSIAFSPDSKILVYGTEANKIEFLNIQDRKVDLRLDYHKYPLTGVQFSSDGKKIVSQDTSQRIILCNLENIRNIQNSPMELIFDQKQKILIYTYSYDDKMLAIGLDDSSINLIEINTGKENNLIGHTGQIKTLAFNKNGTSLVSACSNYLLLWNLIDNYKVQILSVLEYQINSLLLLDEKEIIIGADNYIAYGQFQYNDTDYCINIKYSYPVKLFPKSDFAVIVQDKIIHILDLNTSVIINSIIFDKVIDEIEISNDKQRILLFNKYNDKIDLDLNTFQQIIIQKFLENKIIYQYNDLVMEKLQQQIVFYNIENQEIENENKCINILDRNVKQFSIQNNQKIMACLDFKDKMYLYDLKNKIEIEIETEIKEKIIKIAFSPLKPILSTINKDGSLYFWDINKKLTEYEKFSDIDDNTKVKLINYSPDGTLLIIYSDDLKIRILDEINGQKIKIIDIPYNIKSDIQVSYDNKTLAFQDCNGIQLLNLIENKQQNIFNNKPQSEKTIFSFSPNRIALVLLDNDNLLFVNINTGDQIINIQPPNNEYYQSICFSQNGEILVTVSKYLRIWKCSENKIEMIGAKIFKDQINQVAFIEDDKYLLYNIGSIFTQLRMIPLTNCNLKAIFTVNQDFVQFLNDGQYMLTSDFCTNEIFDCKLQRSIATFQASLPNVVFFQQSLKCLIEEQNKIYHFNILSNNKILIFESEIAIQQIKLIHNDKFLIVERSYYLDIFNIENIEQIQKIDKKKQIHQFKSENLQKFSWSGNNHYICYRPNSDFVIRQFKTQKNVTLHYSDQMIQQLQPIDEKKILFKTYSYKILTLSNKDEEYLSDCFLAISFDQKLIASSQSASIVLYEKNNQEKQLSILDCKESLDCEIFPGYNYKYFDSGQFSRDGNQLFCLSKCKKVFIIDINDKQQMKIRSFIEFQYQENITNSPSLNYLSFTELTIIKLINMNWIVQTNMLSLKTKKKEEEEDKNSQFLICNDNSKIIRVFSNKLWIYQIDQVMQFEKKDIGGCIECLVETENGNICVGFENMIQVVNLNRDQNQENVFLQGHEQKILTLCYSQNNQLLASSGSDQKIFLWNLSAKKKIAVLEGHQKTVNQLSFSSDGITLASASDDQLIKLWNIQSSEQTKISKGHQKCVNFATFSKDGLMIASCSEDKSIILWDLIEKTFITKLENHTDEYCYLCFSSSNKRLASGGQGIIWIWDITIPNEAKLFFQIKEDNKHLNLETFKFAMLYSNPTQEDDVDGSQLYVQFWNLDSEDKNYEKSSKLETFEQNEDIFCLSSDSQYLFYAYNKTIKVYDIKLKQNLDLEGHQYIIKSINSQQYSNLLLSLDQQNIIIIWKQSQFQFNWEIISQILLEPLVKQIEFYHSYQLQIDCVASMNEYSIVLSNLEVMKKSTFKKDLDQFISDDIELIYLSKSENFFVVSTNREIILLDSISGEIVDKILKQKKPLQLSISQDDKYLAILYPDIIKIFQLFQQNNREIIDITESIQALEFCWNDSNILYTAQEINGLIKIWNLKSKQYEIKINIGSSCQIQFSKTQNILAVFSYEKQISIINIDSKENFQQDFIEKFDLITFSQNGNLIATVAYNTIKLVNISDKRICSEFYLFPRTEILYIAFSQDDKHLICCQDQSILIFNIQNERQLIIERFQQFETCAFCTFCLKNQSILLFQKKGEKYTKQFFKMNYKQQLGILYDKNHMPQSFAITDDNYCLTINQNGLILWDINSKIQLVNSTRWSGDKVLACERLKFIIKNRNKIAILDISDINNIIETILPIQQPVKFISLSSNHSSLRYLLCGFLLNEQSYIKVWAIYQSKIQSLQVFKYTKQEVTNMAFGNYGQFLVYNGKKKLKLYMINYQTTIVELFKPANSHFFLSQDGNYFFMLMDDRLCMFDQQLKEIEIQQQQQLQGKFSNINRINQASKVLKFAFLCGQQIIIVDIIQQNSQFISEEIIVIDEEKPQTVALSPFGDLLITGDQIGTIKLWDLKKIQEPLWVFKNESHIIQRFSFNPNGTDIVAAVGDGSVNLYSIDYFEDQNILENNDNQKQNQNQSQVKDKEDKKLKFTCYKSFTRQSLIQADHCKINNSQICQNGKSILELFKQKGAI